VIKIKKIIFGITGLTIGGAERVLVDLANRLCIEYDITIFTLYSKGELEEQLDKKIKLLHLYTENYNELNRIQRIKTSLDILLRKNKIYCQYIKNRFDIEIAFLEGPITRLFGISSNKNKYAWVHTDISTAFGKGIKNLFKKISGKRVYKKYKKIVFVSNDSKEKFINFFELNLDKYTIIENYIDEKRILNLSVANHNKIFDSKQTNFITVARLVEQKGIDRFIRIHKRLIENNYKNKVFVIGDGPIKDKLQEQIDKENIQETFILLGKKTNPYTYIKQADCFCLLSYSEGYGMVVEEAKILNKQIIVTNTAAKEAVKGYNKAVITENNEESIYKSLIEIIKKQTINDTQIYKSINGIIIKKFKELVGD